MNEYHKIQTVFKRDPANNHKTLLDGEYAKPEFRYLQDCDWLLSEKVDGTNIRIKYDGQCIVFGGKTDNAQLHSDLINTLNKKIQPKFNVFKEIFGESPACLYGEGYGAGIQKGGCYRPDKDFVLFDVFINDFWLERENVEDIAIKTGLDIVPIMDMGNLHKMVEYAKNGFKSHWGDFQAEGIVARPLVEMRNRYNERIITKIKCKDFKRT